MRICPCRNSTNDVYGEAALRPSSPVIGSDVIDSEQGFERNNMHGFSSHYNAIMEDDSNNKQSRKNSCGSGLLYSYGTCRPNCANKAIEKSVASVPFVQAKKKGKKLSPPRTRGFRYSPYKAGVSVKQ
ncbi:hypothetical protein FNV43_RR12970 [Rhamnella rubrinervis]|uniref:Uncharacterized protein n=1 Tax=Rhamnella rubrinervis TaxID=2594499 RepID=A0A8K0MEN2_9ROSA|nr:hypothetical protein FNV43_RR12970 [Rhamnella rubrinervis]